ncbi:MAG: DMT family transporter [Candidatus Jordarchaeaceae archaeon]
MKFTNLLLFLLLALLWGTGWPATKMALSYVPSPVFMLHRFTFSTIAMFPVFLVLRKRVPNDTKTLKNLLLLCVINTFGVMVTNTGLEGESSGIGSVLTYTQPIFVFCLSILFLGEKINMFKLIGTIIGFIGVILLFLGKIHTIALISSLLLIFGAFIWAVTMVYYKRFLSHVDSFVTNFFQWAFGVVPLGVFNLYSGRLFFPQELMYFWMVLYTSIGSAIIGWTIWLYLLQNEDVTIVSSSSFIVPLVALFSGWLFLGEKLAFTSILGSILTLSGVFLVNKKYIKHHNT